MSLIDIKTMAGEFATAADLQDYCNKQYIALTKSIEEIKKLTEEVNHLKSLLQSVESEYPVERVIISKEEALIDSQIDLIASRAIGISELTLEDVKKIDLLYKNKALLKEQGRTIAAVKKKPPNSSLSNAELIQIASVNEIKKDE